MQTQNLELVNWMAGYGEHRRAWNVLDQNSDRILFQYDEEYCILAKMFLEEENHDAIQFPLPLDLINQIRILTSYFCYLERAHSW